NSLCHTTFHTTPPDHPTPPHFPYTTLFRSRTSVDAAHGGTCRGKSCWTAKPTSLVYRNADRSPTGTIGVPVDEARRLRRPARLPAARPAVGCIDARARSEERRVGKVGWCRVVRWCCVESGVTETV